MNNLKGVILIISIFIYFISFIPYLIGILKNEVKPRPLSWLGWSMLLGIGIFSQIYQIGFNTSMLITISSAVVCLSIFLISLVRKQSKNEKIDYVCFFLGIICMIIYMSTGDAFITTAFAILSDFLVGIPTILNVYKNPKSEDILAWGLGSFAIFLSFAVALTESGILFKIYPSYLLFFNVLIFVLCLRRFGL
jgi:hypothetical protein